MGLSQRRTTAQRKMARSAQIDPSQVDETCYKLELTLTTIIERDGNAFA